MLSPASLFASPVTTSLLQLIFKSINLNLKRLISELDKKWPEAR
jgi:hypothetical protein